MAVTQIADQVSDTDYRILHKLSKLVDLPSFVKSASPTTKESTAGLPNGAFGDPVDRKFPCHTKSATLMSQLYFLEQSHCYPKSAAVRIQDKISAAANYWGIRQQVKRAKDEWTETQRTDQSDLPDSDYALVVHRGDLNERSLPINNAENVKAAAEYIFNHRSNLPFDWRHIAARKILHKKAELAAELDPETEEYMNKAAGFGSTPPSVAAERLANRILMIPNEYAELRENGTKLAEAVNSHKTMLPSSQLIKLASLVDRLDQETGLHRYYDEGGVDTPEELFFTITEKTASEVKRGYVELTTGKIIKLADLAKMPVQKLASVMGSDFANAVQDNKSLDIDLEKFARIAATLPRNDAQLLERAVNNLEKESQDAEPQDPVDFILNGQRAPAVDTTLGRLEYPAAGSMALLRMAHAQSPDPKHQVR